MIAVTGRAPRVPSLEEPFKAASLLVGALFRALGLITGESQAVPQNVSLTRRGQRQTEQDAERRCDINHIRLPATGLANSLPGENQGHFNDFPFGTTMAPTAPAIDVAVIGDDCEGRPAIVQSAHEQAETVINLLRNFSIGFRFATEIMARYISGGDVRDEQADGARRKEPLSFTALVSLPCSDGFRVGGARGVFLLEEKVPFQIFIKGPRPEGRPGGSARKTRLRGEREKRVDRRRAEEAIVRNTIHFRPRPGHKHRPVGIGERRLRGARRSRRPAFGQRL